MVEAHELKHYTGTEEVVTVPEGVLKIGRGAFSGNSHIRRVILSDSLEEIGEDAFSRSAIEEIEIPDSVREIGPFAFLYCKRLRKIKLPSQLEKIAAGLFHGCDSLTEIELPSGVTEIEPFSLLPGFEGTGIRRLVIPDGITFVNSAFQKMRQLESVVMPDSVLCIGKDAFRDCTSLKQIRFSKNLRMIKENAFSGCSSLEKIELPDGLLEIGNSAFQRCPNLSEVQLPEKLVKAGEGAFKGSAFSEQEDWRKRFSCGNSSKTYRTPEGYSELRFGDFSFYYREKSDMGRQDPMGALRYERRATDDIAVYRNQAGERVLRIYLEVPTFDSGDREWDSYRKLYVFPHGNQICGVLVAGGYEIAKVEWYEDLRNADELTDKIMKILS